MTHNMNFDLNIDNYSKQELMDMFELEHPFDRNMLEIKETKIRDKLWKNRQVDDATKERTLTFLSKAKLLLMEDGEKGMEGSEGHVSRTLNDLYNSNYELKTTSLDMANEHMVQVRDQHPYLSSYPSEYFPGVINPLKKRIVRKTLNIDTRFRDHYYLNPSTHFHLQLPIQMNDVVQMQLSAVELPTTFYVISKQYNNHYFTVRVHLSDDSTHTHLVIIPDGNYTQTTIMDIINTQLLLAGSPFNAIRFIANLDEITLSGSAQTIVGLSEDAPVSPDPTITEWELLFQLDRLGNEDRNTPLPLKLGWLLGFRNGAYVGNVNYVSEGVIDLSGPRYLFLVVDDYNKSVNNHFFSAFHSSLLNQNILARISLQARPFHVLHQNNLTITTSPREYFGPVNLSNMTVQLLDEYGRVVDLNNMDYSFCLTLTTIYDI